VYVDGFFLARGGYVESGRVVAALAGAARQQGVALYENQTAGRLVYDQGRVTGVQTRQGEHFSAGHLIVCAGSWTPLLLPELAPLMHISGQPVLHIRPRDPALFSAPNFTVFAADVARSGWYGFPYHAREQVVKIANHRIAAAVHPEVGDRLVTDADVNAYRAFVAEAFPALAADPIVFTRLCLYSNTIDGDFLIDRHPEWEGLTVATGGSGHAFKFAPLLGPLITAAALGEAHRRLHKFRWRALQHPSTS
jgi:glycine/D-amino acid oxidase-like deaminating enzyme